MEGQRSRQSIPLSVVAGLSALVLATGGGVAWWSWKTADQSRISGTLEHAQPSENKNPGVGADPARAQKTQPNSATATAEKTLQVYWLRASGNQIALAPSPVKLSSNSNSEALLEAALKQLLNGPTNPDSSTTIPAGTQLLGLTVKDDGIHVDLSKTFNQGGGSSSMTGRLAQVLYTATSLNPDAPVWLAVEGQPLEELGGEGLVIPQPMTRKDFQNNFSL